jgi:hypothetical protein
LKLRFWSVVHLILTADSQFLSPLMFTPSFFRPPVLPPTFKHFIPAPAFPPWPYLSMPATPPGPWALDKVKKRLRAEQVQRDEAASARYRRQEDKQKDEEAQTVKSSACRCSVLLVLTFCCLLLSLAVLVLSSVVLRVQSRKQE